jgi:hypothetical protein
LVSAALALRMAVGLSGLDRSVAARAALEGFVG